MQLVAAADALLGGVDRSPLLELGRAFNARDRVDVPAAGRRLPSPTPLSVRAVDILRR
jgi:hypothetical protein